METILPCHPKDLPKLIDGTVLTLPIIISIAVPMEEVKFWQSDSFLLAVLINSLVLVGMLIVTFGSLPKFIIITLIFNGFIFVSAYIIHHVNAKKDNYLNLPNNFFIKKFTWQAKSVIEIFPEKTCFYEPFKSKIAEIALQDVVGFNDHLYARSKPLAASGISFELRNHVKLDGFKHYKDENIFPILTFFPYQKFILNYNYQVSYKQIVQILEKFRKNSNHEVVFYGFDDYTTV